MRKNVKIASLSFLIILLTFVGWFSVNSTLEKKIIKASDDEVEQDFRLTGTSKWSAEEENNYVDLVWKDLSDISKLSYQIHRSEDGKNWTKVSPNDSEMLGTSDDHSDESRATNFKDESASVDREFRDDKVKDDVPPEVPSVTSTYLEENQFQIQLSSKDKGKEYQWYLTTKTQNTGVKKSDIIKKDVTSEIQGYIYRTDNSPNTTSIVERDSSGRITNVDIEVESSEDGTAISEIDTLNNSWLHVVAVDRANNVSSVKHVELKKDVRATELKDSNRYVNFAIERTADNLKLVDVVLGSAMEKKMKSLEIKIPKNIEIKNYDKLTLPTSWYKFQNSDDEKYKSFTLAMNDNNSISTIKTFLQAIEFTIKEQVNLRGDIQIVFHELVYTSLDDPQGITHYYTFISTHKNWLQAYNLAKKMRYRGLNGYLATLTSAEEHNFVYANIAKQSGWLGGGRLIKKNRQKINDEEVISENIEDYWLTSILAKQWYWVDGPEKGLVFFDKPTFKEGGKAPAGVYQGFNNSANVGSTKDSYEPNNSKTEFILEFAQASATATTKFWNDLAYDQSQYGTGYYVEFSEYGNQKETEEETDVTKISAIPQIVVIQGRDDKKKRIPSADISFNQKLKIGEKKLLLRNVLICMILLS